MPKTRACSEVREMTSSLATSSSLVINYTIFFYCMMNQFSSLAKSSVVNDEVFFSQSIKHRSVLSRLATTSSVVRRTVA